MRFAYIDSHGNEVPIPSVDALALRIELGAIGPDTELYDAQADHWGPAKTHEIFHTLSRDSEDEGFVAPPPPVAAAPPPAVESSPGPDPEPAPAEEEAPSEGAEPEEEFDLGLTLAEPPPEAAEEAAEPGAADEVLEDLDLDVAPAATAESAAAPGSPDDELPLLLEDEEPAAAEPEGAVSGQDGGFDFGDLSGGLELEDSPAEEASEAGHSDFGAGMELETEMEFTGPTGGLGDAGGDLQMETPMSEFQPDAPPGWMEAGDTGPDDDVMDFSTVSTEAVTEEGPAGPVVPPAAGQGRVPRDRPSAPKFRKQRSAAPIVLVVIALALGVGGYVGWPILSARLAERNAPDRPPVVMPVIPEELLPQMRSLAEAAIADALDDVSQRTAVADAPAQPDDDWLGGVYLGNASQFPGIEAFWTSIGQFVDGVRQAEWQLYHDKYVEQVQAAGLEAETAASVIERADSGFVAAESMREQTYAAMERVVDAALDLHDFLLTNEDDIEYRPAATSTADPVLEAVPSTQALGDEMWRLVGEVTDALGELGATYPFTRERLRAALLERLREVGIQ